MNLRYITICSCVVSIYRYKREEVKIQAWENHEKRKAEMEMKRMEVLLDLICIYFHPID